MHIKTAEEIVALQQEHYKNRIGTKFGTYEITDVYYDWDLKEQMWEITCVKCGKSVTVAQSIGRDWLRGKGRSQEKCENCKAIELEKDRIKKAEEQARRQKEKELKEQARLNKIRAKQEMEKNSKYAQKEYIGKKYGNLTVVDYQNGYWHVKCDCGFVKTAKPTLVILGKIRTCGRKECEYHKKHCERVGAYGDLTRLNGLGFESDVESLLKSAGYSKVKKTPHSNDFGVDVLAMDNNNNLCAFQAKQNWKTKSATGVNAVKDVFAGGAFYDCNKLFVISTTGYTANAMKMAKKLNVILLNEDLSIYDPTNRTGATKYKRIYWEIDSEIKSAKEWCDIYGKKYNTILEKIKREHITPKEALTSISKGNYTIGTETKHKTEWCKQYGLTLPAVEYRMKKLNIPFEQALIIPKKQKL